MRLSITSLLLLTLVSILGCSSSNPVSGPDISSSGEIVAGGHTIAAAGILVLDNPTGAHIEPNRDVAFHFDVTSFLKTACPGGCIDVKVLDITGETWTIEITIVNPTSIQVYDVRVIYYNTAGKKILNPDGYIDLYGKPVSPFTAFAKEYPNRAFPVGPGGMDSEILELQWQPGQPSYVAYLVDVSIGGNCDEPYMIQSAVSNPIPKSGGSAIVEARVLDWQNDPTDCFLDWTTLGGSVQQMPLTAEGDGYRAFELEIDVAPGFEPGKYPLIFEAKEFKPKLLHLYDVVMAEILEEATPIKLSGDGYRALLNFTSKTVGAFGNNVYVVWSDNSLISNKERIYLKEFRDGNWLDKYLVSETASFDDSFHNPSIAPNALTGDLHFLWEGYFGGDMSICYRARKNDSWGTLQALFYGVFSMDSQIDVEDNSEIHVVFQDADGPFLCLYWIHDPGTGAFEEPFILAEPPWPGDPYYAPAIDHDSQGWVHVPFMSGAGGENNVGYKRYNGTSWSGLSWLTTDYNSFYPDITVAPNRKATLIYQKDDGDFWMKTWTGSWESQEHRVTSGADVFGVPNSDCDSLGNVHLAYCGESDGDKDIYYTVHDEASGEWSAPINLTDNTSDSQDPSLFVGPDDSVHIVWDDNVDGDYGVYYLSL